MIKRRSLLALALLGMSLVAAIYVRAADAPAKSDAKEAKPAEPLALPAGFTVKSDAKDIGVRKELATATNNAMTLNHFDNFIANLVSEDEKRIGDFKDRKFTDLDGKINVIRTFWKDKYGKDFDVSADPALTGPFASVVMGEVADSSQASANWPVDARTAKNVQESGEAVPASAREGSKPLDKGRDVAIVRIGASHHLPAVTASMMHQGIDNWRFDIPNDRTGQQIHDDLLRELSTMAEHSKDWPNDVNEGYRMAAHHVMLAIYGVKAQPAGGDRTTEKPAEKP